MRNRKGRRMRGGNEKGRVGEEGKERDEVKRTRREARQEGGKPIGEKKE